MKAIKIIEGKKAELCVTALPNLRDDYVLCKVKCIALNPADWKNIDWEWGAPGCAVGCDFSGVIEEIDTNVIKDWKNGDRIASFVHGSNPSQHEDGCFAEYCVAKGDFGIKIPDSMNDEEAATLGAGVITCGQALYKSLGDIPMPGDGHSDGYLLVYGGSTATGTLAIQYAKLSGCKVIATASPHNFELLKQRGAEEVFDYRDPDCAKKIREHTDDGLTKVLDCIAEGDSPRICEEAVGTQGGTISFLFFTKAPSRTDVESRLVMGYTILGEAYDKFGRHQDAISQDFERGKRLWELTERLVEDGKLVPHPATVCEGGLEGVFNGFQQLRDGKVSGAKLVYRVEQTPVGIDT